MAERGRQQEFTRRSREAGGAGSRDRRGLADARSGRGCEGRLLRWVPRDRAEVWRREAERQGREEVEGVRSGTAFQVTPHLHRSASHNGWPGWCSLSTAARLLTTAQMCSSCRPVWPPPELRAPCSVQIGYSRRVVP